MDKIYAICGAAFFLAFGVIAVYIGTPSTAKWVMLAFLFAGLSQLTAQGQTPTGYLVSVASTVIAMVLAFAIVVTVLVTS